MDEIDFSSLEIPEKEKRILQSAIGVFSEKGFSAATTNEIAKNAGIAEGTIFRYYKTKKDILRGILIQMINLLSGKIVISGIDKILDSSEGKDIRSIMKEFLYDRMKLAESVLPMVKVVIAEALHHEDVREALYQNIILKAMESFKTFHKKMSERGLIRTDIPPEDLFRSIIGSMATLVGPKVLFGNKPDFGDFEKMTDISIDILLNGIVPHEK